MTYHWCVENRIRRGRVMKLLPSKDEFREELPENVVEADLEGLSAYFATLQRELKETEKSMLVIVDGWESSGKGHLLKELTRPLDPKHYKVSVFEEASEQEDAHPYLYRFFMRAPAKGQISFFDRSFYYDLLDDVTLTDGALESFIQDIHFLEKALADDDTLIVKFFLHQTEAEMENNIKTLERDPYRRVRLDERDYRQLNHYDAYYQHFSEVIARTNAPSAPWEILFVDHCKDTVKKALELCVNRLELFLNTDTTREELVLPKLPQNEANLPLAQVDFTRKVTDTEYEQELMHLQKRARDLLYQVYLEGKAVIVAYEGTDAAGKDGNIERLTRYMDPRGYEVATVSEPTKDERAHHYLWRFYREFPTKGRMTIFDRSWYGRVLVERVERLTPTYRWQEAYREINQMEQSLIDDDYLVLKYLLVIDEEEQLERFEKRAEDPMKQYKLTAEDWRAHEQFAEYEQAMNEMVFYTSTPEAPWKVISGNDKRYARIAILKDFITRVSEYLESEKD